MLFDAKRDSFCAIHALNHILQGEFPWFSEADLREGATLARLADTIAGVVAPIPHDTPTGNFSSEAIGRALGRRYFDWRGVQLYSSGSVVNDELTVVEAFGSITLSSGPVPILGVFVHQGAHYTAMIRRGERIFHIDSLASVSHSGQYVHEVSPALFTEYVQHFRSAGPAPRSRHVGGLFSVFYTGPPVQSGPPARSPTSREVM